MFELDYIHFFPEFQFELISSLEFKRVYTVEIVVDLLQLFFSNVGLSTVSERHPLHLPHQLNFVKILIFEYPSILFYLLQFCVTMFFEVLDAFIFY